MPDNCAVYGCTSKYKNKSGISFYTFPRDEEVRKAWVSLCSSPKEINPVFARVCSRHFQPSDYKRQLKYELLDLPVPRQLKMLKPDAVPNICLPEPRGTDPASKRARAAERKRRSRANQSEAIREEERRRDRERKAEFRERQRNPAFISTSNTRQRVEKVYSTAVDSSPIIKRNAMTQTQADLKRRSGRLQGPNADAIASDNVIYIKDEFNIKEEPLDERDMEVAEDEKSTSPNFSQRAIDENNLRQSSSDGIFGSTVPQSLSSAGPSTSAVAAPLTVPEQGGSNQMQLLVLPNLVVQPNPVEVGRPSSVIGRPSTVVKNELDEHVARMVFATNSSFSLVEHPYFREMVTKIQPDYSPPTRKDIENLYLPMVYKKERKKCADKLKDETVCLSLGGWSTVHIDPFICVTLMTTNGHMHLVDAIDMTGKPRHARYFKELVKSTVCKAEEGYGCHVRSLVTDHVSNVAKMRKQLEKIGDSQLDLIIYVCSSHVLNLLAQDLELVSVKERVIHVVKYFRNSPTAYTRYLQEGGEELIMPQDTREPIVPGDKRWNIMSHCLKVFISNLPLLMRICEGDGEEVDRTVRNGLQRAAEELLSRLEPVAVALDKTQSGTCTIAEAVDIWKELGKKFDNDQKVTFRVRSRYSQVITKAHLLANLLHPSMQGRALTEEEKETAIKFAEEKCPGLVPILTKFQDRSPPFEDFKFSDQVTSNISAVEWWQSHANLLDRKSMSLVRQLLSALASSAGGDKSLSSYSLMRSRLSNSLGTKKAAQSVFLYQAFNQH
ncbi:uncharacterized protein LOC143031207 isoform X2 [Oratosquilla oratoria]|uniref:uncharacterized protein LOC143031207 isoform X2 n=1 Tax=Oratosquilla oratoria TaxID=337810 RepID=UPI003F7742B4